MSINFEWDCETIDAETGDVLDHDHADDAAYVVRAAAEIPATGEKFAIVLVRDVWDGEDLKERAWAYVENGELPSHFRDGLDRPAAAIPVRFRRELAAALRGES